MAVFNDINTTGVTFTLQPGNYTFNLSAIETEDQLDLLSIIGVGNWQWSTDGVKFYPPLFGDDNTYYGDELLRGLTLTIRVIEETEFTVKTDDTFEYPNDDTPSNPLIDLEVLAEGELSTIFEDFIGNVQFNVISTEHEEAINHSREPINHSREPINQNPVPINHSRQSINHSRESINQNLVPINQNPVPIESLENDFFRTDLPYGAEGSGALLVTEPSPNLVSVTWEEDNGEVFFWNGAEAIKLDLTEGDNQLLLNPVSDEWGFIVTDKINANDINVLTLNSVELVDSSEFIDANELNHYVNIYLRGDINEIDLVGNTFEIGTGKGARSVRIIANKLMRAIFGDRKTAANYLSSFGTEGSYFELTGLDNGVYSFEIETWGKIDKNNNDSLYVWNSKDFTLVADNENGIIETEVDVIYGELSFIALDSVTKTGTTEFTITNISKVGDLPYTPPERIDLIPDEFLGDVDFLPNQTRVSNGGGDRAISTLIRKLGIDLTGLGTDLTEQGANTTSLPADLNQSQTQTTRLATDLTELGTEGSYATWEVENGTYSITYSLYASEDDFDHDDIYFYDGENLTLFDSRSSATIQSSATRWVSESKIAEIDVTGGELTFITLDTVDKSGTTGLRITNIERIGDIDNTITGNDSFAQSVALNEDQVLTGIATEYHYFDIDWQGGDIIISLDFQHDLGDLDLYLYDSNYNQVAFSYSSTDNENILIDDLPVGEYFVEIEDYTVDSSNEYQISYSPGNVSNLDEGQFGNGNLAAADSDYYIFEVDEFSLFNFEINNPNLEFTLFDSSQDAIASAANSPSNSATNFDAYLSDGNGDFILGVKNNSNVTEQYQVLWYDSNKDDYIYSEPPDPIPETGKDLDLDMGTLKPWESDDITGTEYHRGYVYPSYHLGASYITEFIGGDDLTDYINFTLDEDSYLNFFHSNAIAEILDSNYQVIVGSQDSYSGNLQAFLTPGDYAIAFSSESSISELFYASIYLSNSDPYYAD